VRFRRHIVVAVALGALWRLHVAGSVVASAHATDLPSLTTRDGVSVTTRDGVSVTTRDGVSVVRLADRAVRFEHLPDGVLRWAPLPSGRLVAVADRKNDFDRSWASSLLIEGGNGVELCDRVFHASRPLVTPDGDVVVERGRAGEVQPGRMRVDELTLDVVDAGGRARTLYRARGFEAHLAGLAGGEVIVYLVQPDVASLRAIDLATGRERVIVPSLAPFASDFAVAGGAIELTNRDDADRHRLVRERIDAASGARTRLGDVTP
jgi:hypothetical protein